MAFFGALGCCGDTLGTQPSQACAGFPRSLLLPIICSSEDQLPRHDKASLACTFKTIFEIRFLFSVGEGRGVAWRAEDKFSPSRWVPGMELRSQVWQQATSPAEPWCQRQLVIVLLQRSITPRSAPLLCPGVLEPGNNGSPQLPEPPPSLLPSCSRPGNQTLSRSQHGLHLSSTNFFVLFCF